MKYVAMKNYVGWEHDDCTGHFEKMFAWNPRAQAGMLPTYRVLRVGLILGMLVAAFMVGWFIPTLMFVVSVL